MKLALPAWFAAMVQVPAATPRTVEPLSVQIEGVWLVKVGCRPEVAVAETVPVPPTVMLGAVPKLSVCVALLTVIFTLWDVLLSLTVIVTDPPTLIPVTFAIPVA